MSHEAVGWGLIGTSGWADHTFAPAIRSAGAELLGAAGSCAEGSEAFARRHGAARTYRDVDALLADDDVSSVWIASPTDLHPRHAIAALDAGKHVLVEKPMAVTLVEAETMAAAAAGCLTTTAVGFQHRFNPSHQRLAEALRSGELGDLLFVRLHQFIDAGGPPGEWRQDPSRSGGWAINDLGTHLLDLLRFFVGDVEVIGGALAAAHFDLAVDDLAVVYMQSTTAGAVSPVGVIEASTAVPENESVMDAYGSLGTAHLTNSWPGGGTLSIGHDVHEFEAVDTYAAQVRAFGVSVIEGSPYLGATWRDGLENVRLVEAACRRSVTDLQQDEVPAG